MRFESQFVFDGVEFRAFWRQRNDGDVGRNDEAGRQVPASLIDQEDGMGGGCDCFADLRKMQVHRLAVAGRQDEACAPLPSLGQIAPKM